MSELQEGIDQTIKALQFASGGLEDAGHEGWANEVDEGIATLRVCKSKIDSQVASIRELVRRLEESNQVMAKTAMAHSVGCRCEICEAVIWNKACMDKHDKEVQG